MIFRLCNAFPLKKEKKVLGALIRINKDPCWHKYASLAQHSINTSPHSTLENSSPHRVLFGREPNKRLEDIGIPDNIAQEITIPRVVNTRN